MSTNITSKQWMFMGLLALAGNLGSSAAYQYSHDHHFLTAQISFVFAQFGFLYMQIRKMFHEQERDAS